MRAMKHPFRLCAMFFVLLSGLANAQGFRLVHADIHTSSLLPDGRQMRVLDGNVHGVRDTLQLYCDYAEFFDVDEAVRLSGNLRIISPSMEIQSARGRLNNRMRNIIFIEEVIYRNGERYLYTDSLVYFFDEEMAEAHGNVVTFNPEDSSTVFADKGIAWPQENRFIFRENARYVRPDKDDSLTIDAGNFYYSEVAKNRIMSATGKVQIRQDKLWARSDSAAFLMDQNLVQLFREPIALYELQELVGDTLELITNAETGDPETLFLRGNAEVTSPEDSTRSRDNYLSGFTIEARLQNKKMEWVEARDNAISIYYFTQDSSREGGNHASADTIRLFFNENEVDSVAIRGGVEGTYLPEKLVDQIKNDK
jgi:lipopolysaccharide export system protein LptA